MEQGMIVVQEFSPEATLPSTSLTARFCFASSHDLEVHSRLELWTVALMEPTKVRG